jgi:hypothetical protein
MQPPGDPGSAGVCNRLCYKRPCPRLQTNGQRLTAQRRRHTGLCANLSAFHESVPPSGFVSQAKPAPGLQAQAEHQRFGLSQVTGAADV